MVFAQGFTLQVLVRGVPLLEYPHNGEFYVEGRRGDEYTLRVLNHTDGRVLAVLSVDGLSIMNGQPASIHGSGYIIDAYGTCEVPGWRLNNNEVARFFFGALPDAYAAQMGRPSDIGVIGASIFREKRPIVARPSYPPAPLSPGGGAPAAPTAPSPDEDLTLMRPAPASAAPGAAAAPMPAAPEAPSHAVSHGIGTGFGARSGHQVVEARFEREEAPAAVLVLRYDDAAGLQARGIQVLRYNDADRVARANPFPADRGAPPPPGWRG